MQQPRRPIWLTLASSRRRAGHIVNKRALRQRLFCSGCEPDVRREAWKFVLGLRV